MVINHKLWAMLGRYPMRTEGWNRNRVSKCWCMLLTTKKCWCMFHHSANANTPSGTCINICLKCWCGLRSSFFLVKVNWRDLVNERTRIWYTLLDDCLFLFYLSEKNKNKNKNNRTLKLHVISCYNRGLLCLAV